MQVAVLNDNVTVLIDSDFYAPYIIDSTKNKNKLIVNNVSASNSQPATFHSACKTNIYGIFCRFATLQSLTKA